jgi:hypothetical protein
MIVSMMAIENLHDEIAILELKKQPPGIRKLLMKNGIFAGFSMGR